MAFDVRINTREKRNSTPTLIGFYSTYQYVNSQQMYGRRWTLQTVKRFDSQIANRYTNKVAPNLAGKGVVEYV